MSNFELVDPQSGFEYDLQSIYSAFIGYFQVNNIPWYDRSWSGYFGSFEDFLAFSWPTITATDSWTGRPHIATRFHAIDSFVKMIKQRHGEVIQPPPNIVRITPFEISQRPLRHISDLPSYKKLHATLPAVSLSAFRARVRAGEPKAIRELWSKKDKAFLTIDFEWSERNSNSCLEFGYAAVRCGHIDSAGQWPPIPNKNYRKGHYIVSEYVDKAHNKHRPTHPWQYAFGDSLLVSKSKVSQVIEALITSLSSPDSETVANNLVLVGHGINNDLKKLEEMKIKIPHNMLIVDIAAFEKALYSTGERQPMLDPKTGQVRAPGSVLSLENLLISFTIPSPDPAFQNKRPIILPDCMMHNAGNDAFLALFALQYLLEPMTTQVPAVKAGRIGRPAPSPLGPLPPPVFPTSRSGSPNGSPGGTPGGTRRGHRTSMLTPDSYHSQLTPPLIGGHARSRTSSGNLLPVSAVFTGDGRPDSSQSRRHRTKSNENDLAGEFGAMALERNSRRASMMPASSPSMNGLTPSGHKQEKSRSKSPARLLDTKPSSQEKDKTEKTKRRSSTMEFMSSLRAIGR